MFHRDSLSYSKQVITGIRGGHELHPGDWHFLIKYGQWRTKLRCGRGSFTVTWVCASLLGWVIQRNASVHSIYLMTYPLDVLRLIVHHGSVRSNLRAAYPSGAKLWLWCEAVAGVMNYIFVYDHWYQTYYLMWVFFHVNLEYNTFFQF